MKVLVLGGGGFIGPRVMQRFVDRGHDVATMDINTNSPMLEPLKQRIEVMRGDVTLFDDVIDAVIQTKPDRILNLAYLLGFRPDGVTDAQDPHYAVRINILGMDNAFEAARLCGVKRVIYASSLAVYGRQSFYGERPLTEDDIRMGSGVYSASKIFNEHQAEWYNKAYDMQITGIRPSNVTGPDKVRGSMDHVRVITEPARGIPVTFPYKDSMRLPIHVDDISEMFTRVTLAEKTQHAVYNSGGETISMGDIAALVQRYLPDARITFENETGGRELSGNYMMDNSRMVSEFEYDLAPYPQRVLEIINAVRADEGLPPVGV
jgi:nucleoside-diphosphate-sugar epimerase